MSREQIPNAISFFRLLLVPPVAWCIVQAEFGWALILFATAGVSDGVDGYLARRYNWRTRLGGFLDPLADKALMITTFVTLAVTEHVPWWLAGLVVLRDVVIMGGALLYHFLTRALKMSPTIISKFNTVLQIVLVVAVLLNLGGWPSPDGLVRGLILLVTLSTLLSGVVYVVIWGRRLGHEKKHVAR